MFPFSPPPLSRAGGERREKNEREKKREMLNASQLARTRGDGEICTKELPHSLAAFSSRNHTREEGSLSPRHQSGCSRQRRFAMTPSRTATQWGQDPSTTCTLQESELLQNTPRHRASKQAQFNVELSKILNGGAVLLPLCSHKAPGELQWLSGH